MSGTGPIEYNFEKLVNPPDYAPTTCVACRKIIKLGEGGYSRGYSRGPDGYRCDACTDKMLAKKRRNPSGKK